MVVRTEESEDEPGIQEQGLPACIKKVKVPLGRSRNDIGSEMLFCALT